ncbi:MAG TPA: PLP-dependent aminotransferase family protein, partial [Chloroflexota bacterium]|nr:PLP-dependent aminotransferase family protein [Chloroflexota bacterium]
CQAYAELEAEGYLVGRHGSGSYVSSDLPEDPSPSPVGEVVSTRAEGVEASEPRQPTLPGTVARYSPASESIGVAFGEGKTLAALRQGPPRGLPFDFHPGQGAWDGFPVGTWRRLLARQWRRGWRETMDYGDPAGYRPLREEVASYLARSRAVHCTADEVVIVNGTQQALDLLSRVLLSPGGAVAVEDPGYPSARPLFAAYRARLLPIEVDQEGMVVDRLRGSGARLALVTPSHQFPTGALLTLPRRLSLLGWARAEGGLVVEDDYDSGFRFEGRPLASLQGLDSSGRVVYLGSFSRVLFPSLRVGYAVLPPGLVGPFVEAKELTDRQTPILEQQLLAGFLGEGHFERHLRRMRQLYRRRREALVEALRRRLEGKVQAVGAPAGMHLMVRLLLPMEEDEVVARAAAFGVAVYPAGPYYTTDNHQPALVIGYAGMDEERIVDGIDRLSRSLEGC